MDITIFDTADELARAAAGRVADALRRNPDVVLGLPAGQSPVKTYAELCRQHASGDADFSRATAFIIDEFVGLDASHPASFRRFVTDHLLAEINLDPARVYALNGVARDPDGECQRYEEAIATCGGLDLLLLGIGANGHVGFNEPGTTLVSRTHRVKLLPSTRRDNAGLFGGDVARVPRYALSMGMAAMLRAGMVVLIATGPAKADAVARMIDGPLTTRLPASLLQLHRHVEVYLDRAAASAL